MYIAMFTYHWTLMKFSDPTPEPVPAPDGGQTTWEKFSLEKLNYLDINNTVELKQDYNQQNFAFWRDYISYITGITTTRK